MAKHRLGALNIQLFADGGAVGEGASVGDSQTGDNATVNQGTNPDAGENDSQMQNAEGGMQNADMQADEILDNFYKEHPEAKKAADKRTAKAVQGRVYQMNKSMQKNDAVLQKLMVRYNVEDVDALSKALDSDEVFESLAAERGENPDTMRELERLKVLEAMQNRSRAEYERERAVAEQLERWRTEADEVKKTYGNFELEKELENPEFRALITTKNPQYKISMEQAYKLIHHDELIKMAESEAAEKFSKSVQTRSQRPSENGLGNQSGVTMTNDVHKLTKKERAELAKRAARGERIEF